MYKRFSLSANNLSSAPLEKGSAQAIPQGIAAPDTTRLLSEAADKLTAMAKEHQESVPATSAPQPCGLQVGGFAVSTADVAISYSVKS
jgi:hypothetical protein